MAEKMFDLQGHTLKQCLLHHSRFKKCNQIPVKCCYYSEKVRAFSLARDVKEKFNEGNKKLESYQ